MKDSILRMLLGKDLLVLPEADQDPISDGEKKSLIGSIEESFASLGYALSLDAIAQVEALGRSGMTKFYSESFATLRKAKGADVNHVVFYKNFPEGVMSMSDGELYARAMIHYISVALKDKGVDDYVYMADDIAKKARIPFTEKIRPTVLSVVDHGKALDIAFEYARSVLSGPIAMTDQQVEIVDDLCSSPIFGAQYVKPDRFQFKENLALWVLRISTQYGLSRVFSNTYIDYGKMTATDILRIYGIVSNGEPSITNENIKYVSLPRSARKFIMGTLDFICERASDFDAIEDEFGCHNFRWNCVFRQIHAGEYDDMKYITRIVEDCRSKKGCVTFASRLDAIAKESLSGKITKPEAADRAIGILSKKPGVFARRLDYMLRSKAYSGCEKQICDAFAKAAGGVSIPVLIQLRDHFMNRDSKDDKRVFSYEYGGEHKLCSIPDERAPISEDAIAAVMSSIDSAIGAHEATHADIDGLSLKGKKVFVSDEVSGYAVPTSARTASGSVKTLPRNSRIRLKGMSGSKFIRVFTHWHNNEATDPENNMNNTIFDPGRIDVDLSADFLDKDLNRVCLVSWNRSLVAGSGSLNRTDIFAAHSGDVTTAPKGASEFIDIDVAKARKAGARYVVIANSSYTRQKWCDISECFSGVMVRSKFGTDTGEIYDPRAVEYKFDLTQQSPAMNVAFAYDLEKNELIWIDSPIGSDSFVASYEADGTSSVVRKAIAKRTSMADVIKLASQRFGGLTESRKDADVIFGDPKEGDPKEAKTVRPTDLEVFSGLFL